MTSKLKKKCYHYDPQGNAIPHLIDLKHHKKNIQDDIDVLVHGHSAGTILSSNEIENLICSNEPDYDIQNYSYVFVETLYHTNETKSGHSTIKVDPLVSQNKIHGLKPASFTALSEKTQNDNEIIVKDEFKGESILLNSPIPVYKCEICGFTTQHENIYTNHVKIKNHRKNPSDSRACVHQSSKRKRVSKNINGSRKRIESIQVESKYFKCGRENCNWVSKYPRNYPRHLKVVHNKKKKIEKIYTCINEPCHFNTKYLENFKWHVKLVHMPSLLNMVNPIHQFSKNKATKKIEGKNIKYATNVQNRSKNLKCNYENCNFATEHGNNYYRHLKIHVRNNGTKNFYCEYENCEFATYHKSSYNRHKKRAHARNLNP